jgi:hypothetical protein
VHFLGVKSGLLSAIAIIVALTVAIILIAPEIDLEDGVFGVEQILYALLMALASIVALLVIRIQSPTLASKSFSVLEVITIFSPSRAICRLRC